jgi:hypothetical protein
MGHRVSLFSREDKFSIIRSHQIHHRVELGAEIERGEGSKKVDKSHFVEHD